MATGLYCLQAPLLPWQQGSFAQTPLLPGNRAVLLARSPFSWQQGSFACRPLSYLGNRATMLFWDIGQSGSRYVSKENILKSVQIVSKMCPNCVQNVTKLCPKCVQIPPNVSTLCIIPGSPCQWRSEYFSRWHILDKFWTLCRRFKKCLKSVQKWHKFGYILDIKGTFGHNLDITWTPFGHCLDTLQVWTYFGHFLDTFWTYFGHFHIFGVQNLSIHTSFSKHQDLYTLRLTKI